jgi:hypothetical protein
VSTSPPTVSSSRVSSELDERRRQVRRFIELNFGSQRAFCEATGLKPARVSKALQDRYVSNRRLLPLEHAIDQWRTARGRGAAESDSTIPVYRLAGDGLQPDGDREPIGSRLIGAGTDRDRLLYVEVTYGHHAVIERGPSRRLGVDDLTGTQPPGTVEYAGFVDGVWTYLPVRFVDNGRAELPASLRDRRVVLAGRVIARLMPRHGP